jgi:hypothetical protein
MEKIRIRDGKNSDPGSGINIPDPQHCKLTLFSPPIVAGKIRHPFGNSLKENRLTHHYIPYI